MKPRVPLSSPRTLLFIERMLMKTMSCALLLTTVAGLAALGISISSVAHAAAPGRGGASGGPNPSQMDHDRMAQLLGVTDMRPGARGQIAQANDPDFAPYDESKANDYKGLNPVDVMPDGRKVTTADMWWKEKRPQLVELFDREIYGRMPK